MDETSSREGTKIRSRRKRWLVLLPVALVFGAFILPREDQFAFLKEGGTDLLTIYPDIKSHDSLMFEEPGLRSRGWIYRESASLLYSRVRAHLTVEKGWLESSRPFMGPIGTQPEPPQLDNQDTGNDVVVERDFHYGTVVGSAVFVHETTGLRAILGRLRAWKRQLLSP